MTCQVCGVQFSETRIDCVIEQVELTEDDDEERADQDEAYCSQGCATEAGWYWTDDTAHLTREVILALIAVAQNVSPSRIFTLREHRLLNDTLAIVRFESGAEREAGLPATVPMLLIALKQIRGKEYVFGYATIAQLAATLRILGRN